ncbi:MAG: metallophosphoesterase family protein [Kiritimatiellia bacterium]
MTRREFCRGSAGAAAGWAAARAWAGGGLPVDGVPLPAWAEKTIREGVARYRAWKGADEAVAFPLITDIHSHAASVCAPDWRDTKAHVLFQRALAELADADFLVNLGDLDFDVNILGSAPDWSKVQPVIDGFVAAYAHEPRPVLFAMGNHDHARGRYASKQFGDTFNRGLNAGKRAVLDWGEDGTWGCLDIPAKKFRAIVLNTSDEGYLGFSVRQLQYLADRFSSAPDGWSVAVLQHANIPNFIAKWRRFGDSNGGIRRDGLEQTIIEDFANHRGGIVQGFNNPPIVGQLGGVKFDFARSKANLVGVFQGHLHAESYLRYAKVNYVIRPGYGTIPADCACGEWRDPKRELGFSPAADMMLDLVAVKPAQRRVHVFRLGCGGEKSELEYVY